MQIKQALRSSVIKVEKTINIKTLHYIFIHSAITIMILFLSNYQINPNILYSSYEFVFIIALLCYVWMILSWVGVFTPSFNFYTMFLVVAFLFYFGQYIVYFFTGEVDYTFSILNTYSQEIINRAAFFSLQCMLLLHLGALFGELINKPSINKTKLPKFKISVETMRFVSALFLIVTFIPAIIYLLKDVQLTLIYGYGNYIESNIKNTGISNIFGFIAAYISAAFVLALLVFKDTKWNILIHATFGMYILAYFLSGKRLSAILLMVTYLLIKYYYYKRFTWKDIVKYGVLGFVLIITVTVIPQVRNVVSMSNDPFQLVLNATTAVVEGGPITTLLNGTGVTLIATSTVMVNTPTPVPYNLGFSYLNNAFMLIPNLFWDVNPGAVSNTDIVFSGFLTQYGGIGSSFIAEAYYNFGIFSLLIMPIFGYLLYFLCKKTKEGAETENLILLFLTLYVSSFVLFYVRSDTASFFRNFVYKGLFPVLVMKLFNISSKVRKIN